MQVRTPDAGGKEGVTRKEDGVVEQVTGALRRVSRRTQGSQPQVRDGDTLAIPHLMLTALRTPGHTPESTCYLLNNAILLTGDTLFPLSSIGF